MHQLLVALVDLAAFVPPGNDTPLTLAQAADLPELGGQFTPAMLRDRIRAGWLSAERHGRQDYVTRNDLKIWRENCRVRPSRPDSGSAPRPSALPAVSSPQNGSSRTEGNSTARDAALKTMMARLGPSKPT